MDAVLMIVTAYLLGSLPTGYLLGSIAGVDVRQAGSGNIGATNVARVVGKRQGLMTLMIDVTKGFLPVFVALRLGMSPGMLAIVGAMAFLGHLYPVFLRFHGGKGVATALGVLAALAPAVTPVLAVIFVSVIFSTRIVSVAAMFAAISAPGILWLFSYSAPLIGLGGFFAAMIVLRHRANIQRLLAGTEPKFGA